MPDMKIEARRLFQETLREVDVGLAIARRISIEGSLLKAGDDTFNLEEFEAVLIVSIGKAATSMYEAVVRVVQTAAPVHLKVEAIVVSPQPLAATHEHLVYLAGSHPTPDATSRTAALVILDRLREAGDTTLVFFLISGGSSSMVELPLDPSVSLGDVAEFHRTLVGSGLGIAEMNVLRKHLSAVKGGRLAIAAAPAAQCTLVLSDTPAGALDVVGSGPSLPDSSSAEDCRRIYLRLRSMARLPPTIERFFEADALEETPKGDDPVFQRSTWTSILSSDDLAISAAALARHMGFLAEVDNTCDEWRCDNAAGYLLERSAELRRRAGRSCLISVGELAVMLPLSPGRGGRNQHFVLECALRLAGQAEETTVLSAGSDGIDGNSVAAGAVADGDTCDRAAKQGVDPARVLADFDSFSLFRALGDAIVTGPTGNNVRDLRLLLTHE